MAYAPFLHAWETLFATTSFWSLRILINLMVRRGKNRPANLLPQIYIALVLVGLIVWQGWRLEAASPKPWVEHGLLMGATWQNLPISLPFNFHFHVTIMCRLWADKPPELNSTIISTHFHPNPSPCEFLFLTICIPSNRNAYIRTICMYMLQHWRGLSRQYVCYC